MIDRHVKRLLKQGVRAGEQLLDTVLLSPDDDEPPEQLNIVTYLGHGNDSQLILRGRVLDDAEPSAAVPGEGTFSALRRTVERFVTTELPGVRVLLTMAGIEAEVITDQEGYFDAVITTDQAQSPTTFEGPWLEGTAELAAPVRGTRGTYSTPITARIPGPEVNFGIISDIDDTILQTGAQRVLSMVRTTLLGSALTRVPFDGAAELYRALVAGDDAARHNPIFYVSSSPWNLHGFLTAFLEHRAFPPGPLFLREFIARDVDRTHASGKHERIDEIMAMHADLPFVLIGDSGQHDPEIYAEVVRANPDRILAVYIREVRLDPGDGRVEAIRGAWKNDVPFVLAADSVAVAEHAALIGLISPEMAEQVTRAVQQ